MSLAFMLQQTDLPFGPGFMKPRKGEARTIALFDRIVPYLLRRACRRSIGLSIDHRGLVVGAPKKTPLAEVEAMILKHGDWVAKKLDEWRDRRRAMPISLTDGVRLPYLGGLLEIRLGFGHGQAFWNETATPILTLLPRSPDCASSLLVQSLRRRARLVFGERLALQAAHFGIDPPPALALSSARTRWGSCSLKTGIRLNWRLIHCERRLIDYVIVHELSHLFEMNHSDRFWAIVGQYFPDYREAMNALKKRSGTLPLLQ